MLIEAKPKVIDLPTQDIIKLSNGIVLKLVEEFNRMPVTMGRSYRSKERFFVMISLDDTARFGLLLHVSMSFPNRYPTWTEIKACRNTFFPADSDVMMILPEEKLYVNVAKNCFHLWQTPSAWGML